MKRCFSLVRGKWVWYSCPSPELAKSPYTWIFLPPHFSVGLMRCHVILCLVHLRLLLLAETTNLVSSENSFPVIRCEMRICLSPSKASGHVFLSKKWLRSTAHLLETFSVTNQKLDVYLLWGRSILVSPAMLWMKMLYFQPLVFIAGEQWLQGHLVN